ncbi:hypothetical protein MYX76_07630 [Desulfobacterota bacterium AH_259_B03_O07]|nr:hypothetical protein [Desulfobacterota bacterium AH_259_B03_O07]
MQAQENLLMKWDDLVRFQIDISKRWLKRGREAEDVFTKFFFFFAGFNALYFLWGKMDELKNREGDPAGEVKQIENLLGKFEGKEAQHILETLSSYVDYFCKRSPVQRMDKRTDKSQHEGDPSEGKKWRRKLSEASSPLDRLVALGEILYLVRSNLVHGSKKGGDDNPGDDREIIESSVYPLELLLNKTISLTKSKCP